MNTSLAYGRRRLPLRVPDDAILYQPKGNAPLADPLRAAERGITAPCGAAPLSELARRCCGGRVCIVVSDITRPVPYGVLLPPILACLESNGIRRSDVLFLIATGMHRTSTAAERLEILGSEICATYRIEDHDSTDESVLSQLPRRTSSGTAVSVNRHYLEADLKIATGLVEPHFMAGFSGGRKAICPGLVNLATIQQFHGPRFLEAPSARNGNLAGNPCHREATEVAHIAGVDLLVNVAFDTERRVTGVFVGGLDAAFEQAVAHVAQGCGVAVTAEADLVITSGGGYPLDTTFYQTVKGMVGALPAVRRGGTVLIASECSEGIGSPEYAEIMRSYGGRFEQFLADIRTSSTVRRDQWEFEMQCRVLRKVGTAGLVLVTEGTSVANAQALCVTDARAAMPTSDAETLLQRSVDRCIEQHGTGCRVAVVPDGPYVMIKDG